MNIFFFFFFDSFCSVSISLFLDREDVAAICSLPRPLPPPLAPPPRSAPLFVCLVCELVVTKKRIQCNRIFLLPFHFFILFLFPFLFLSLSLFDSFFLSLFLFFSFYLWLRFHNDCTAALHLLFSISVSHLFHHISTEDVLTTLPLPPAPPLSSPFERHFEPGAKTWRKIQRKWRNKKKNKQKNK